MENLKTPISKVLINSIDYTKVGAYYDSVAGVNMLSFKEHGINIPYVSTAFKGAKACSDAGAVTSQEIEFSIDCPCSECDYDYGVTLVKKVQFPGVNNNETNENRKSFTGTLPKIACTAGVINDQYLLDIEDDIISQIYGDSGTHYQNTDPVTGGGAIAKAVRSYKITVNNANTDGLNFTLTSTGAVTNVALDTTVILSTAAINASAANAYLRAVALSATEIGIYGLTGADLFTVADDGGATTVTIDYRRIWFTALNPEVQFAIITEGIATTYKKYMFVIDGSAAAATVNSGITLFINGVAHDVASNANVAGMAAAINGVGAAHGVYATVVGTDIYVNGTNAVTSLFLAYSLSPANYATGYINATPYFPKVGVYSATATGSYPLLTGKEVFNLLANAGNEGIEGAWGSSQKPDPTAEYCVYFFQTDSSIYATNGASHMDSYRGVVEVFIKKSIVDTAFLYPSANATALSGQGASLNQAPTTTPVVSFEELLQLWAGTGTIAQADGAVTGGSNPNAWTN